MNGLDCTTVWFVTGCSSGLGESLAKAIYQAGHCIVATARNAESLSYLPDDTDPGRNRKVLKLTLDVTCPESIENAMKEALAYFKKIDVFINNAGYGLLGEMEAIPEPEARRLMETNFWGPVNVTRAALQLFRETKGQFTTKTIVQVTSMGGWITAPGHSFYHASKFALEGFTESVGKEVREMAGVNFLIVEPNGMHTKFAASALGTTYRHPAYKKPGSPLDLLIGYVQTPESRKGWSDSDRCAMVLFNGVVGQRERPMPRRLFMGHDTIDLIRKDIEQTLDDMDKWGQEAGQCAGDGAVDPAPAPRGPPIRGG